MSRISCLLVAIIFPATLASQQPKPLDPVNLDTTCAACADFFTFANGGWLKRATIPGDLTNWGAFQELQEANFDALRAVLNDAAANARKARTPARRKLGEYYASCMDSSAIEQAGADPLDPDLARIAAISDRRSLAVAIARLHTLGVGAGVAFHATQDAKNSSRVIAEAYQGGLGLPDRDYYTKPDSASRALRPYQDHVSRVLRLPACPPPLPHAGEAVLAFESAPRAAP